MRGSEVDVHVTIKRALDIARNSDGVVDPSILSCLERSLRDIWSRIEADPENYVFTADEFALFNYFRYRFTNSRTAQRAVERFWNQYQGVPRNLRTVSAATAHTSRT